MTFRHLLLNGMIDENAVDNFIESDKQPDAVWQLADPNLNDGHMACVTYESALHVMPKIIIDAFVNRFDKIPTNEDVEMLMKEIRLSMKSALDQASIPAKAPSIFD